MGRLVLCYNISNLFCADQAQCRSQVVRQGGIFLVRRVNIDYMACTGFLAKSIYSAEGQLLLKAGNQVTDAYKAKLRQLGIYTIYIQDSNFDDVEINDVISEETRMQAVQLCRHLGKMAEAGKDPNKIIAQEIPKMMAIAENIVQDVLASKELVVNLLDMRSASDYLYFHSVNVGVLSVLLGSVMKLQEHQLKDLAVGGMLHDIGKLLVPPEIINKPGPLTDDEFVEMKRHTSYGFERLRTNKDIKLLWAHIALQHHEWYDGSGYPRGLKLEDIHLYGRISTVADVYDALTSERCYRKKPFLPHEAMEMIYALTGSQFDPTVVEAFNKNIAIYPLGGFVQLADGRRGVVVDVNRNCITRPKVRITEEADGHRPEIPYDVKLEDERTLMIEKVLA